jgi:hypothetical protein
MTPTPATLTPATQPSSFQQGWLDRLTERINPHYAILALLPWLLFLINPNWLFQGLGSMDPWFYFGLSLNFPRYQHLFTSYSAERLTWVVPARLFVALLSPLAGWFVFHVCVYCAATFSLYSIIRRLFDAQTAILTATLMGCHPLFIGSNGWTYVDSGSIAYLALAFAALTSAREARHPSAYVTLAGIFWAAAAYTYPLWWILTPCCALFYWGIAEIDSHSGQSLKYTWNRYRRPVAYFGLGLTITTSLMIVCHYCVHGSGGGFFYGQNLGMITFHLTVKKDQVYWGSQSYNWIRTAGWIVFPVLAMVASIVAPLLHILGRKRLSRSVIGICLTYGYAFLALLYLQLRNTHVMEFDYYTSILIPLEFLVLGALVYRVPHGIAGPMLFLILGASALITIMPLMRGVFSLGQAHTLVANYIVGFLAMSGGLVWIHERTWAFAAIGLAVASFGLLPAYPSSAWLKDFNGLAATQRIAEAINIIDSNTPANKYPAFWIDNFNDPNAVEYRAIMCASHSHGFSMWRYPDLDPDRKYSPGTELILITRDKDVFESANATMTLVGMPLRMWKQQLVFGEGNEPSIRVSYWLTFTDVLAPESTVPKGEQLEVVPNALRPSGFLPWGVPGVSVEAGPPVRVTTAAQQWAYAAYEALPFTAADRDKARVRISVKVLRGKVAFGVLSTSEKEFLTRAAVDPSEAFQDVTLEVEHPEDSGKLVVQNETPGGKKAEVLVSRIDLLAYPSSSLSKRLAPDAKPTIRKAVKGH